MAGPKPDHWVREMAKTAKMIEPFSERVAGDELISFGLQPAGYDPRLDPEILVFDSARAQGKTLDPRNLDPSLYFNLKAEPCYAIAPKSFILGMTVEHFRIPRNCLVLGVGKTTYSSAGISVNVSGINPGWEGRLRLHLANANSVPVKVFGNQGIIQLFFVELDGECDATYAELIATRFQGQQHFLVAPPAGL